MSVSTWWRIIHHKAVLCNHCVSGFWWSDDCCEAMVRIISTKHSHVIMLYILATMTTLTKEQRFTYSSADQLNHLQKGALNLPVRWGTLKTGLGFLGTSFRFVPCIVSWAVCLFMGYFYMCWGAQPERGRVQQAINWIISSVTRRHLGGLNAPRVLSETENKHRSRPCAHQETALSLVIYKSVVTAN